MHQVLNEIKKIHKQYTIPATILMAIRARVEMKLGIENRIGRVFENGTRGVLIVGKAGTSKTTCMKAIFDGLGLETINSDGKQIGKWFASTGASTALGIYETLEIYNDSIIFLDEFSLDTPAHVHILKQICNGKLMRQKYGSMEETDFGGLLVCATNAIKLPRSNQLEHLLATLDRFFVVKSRPAIINPANYMSTILTDAPKTEVNWPLLRLFLATKNNTNLSSKEKALLQRIWEIKSAEILDPTRAQWRNCWTAYDIMLFTKRMFDIPDITADKEAIQFIKNMINDVILFNPVGILWLRPLEEVIYNKIVSKSEVTLQEIISECENKGMSVSVRHIHNILNTLMQNRIIYRARHGTYSIKKNIKRPQAQADKSMQTIMDIL